MADFFDRQMASDGAFYWHTLSDVDANNANYYWCFPRQIKARVAEAAPVRAPRVYVYVNDRLGRASQFIDLGGTTLGAGETIHDAQDLHVRMGFEDDSADRVLAFSTCSVRIPKASVTNAPTAGQRMWVQIGVDTVNRVNVFQGMIENARESGDGRSYEVIAFDDVRRLLDYPFDAPVTFSDVDGAYIDDYDESTLEASVQIQVSELLSAADVLTHSLTGIEQYPIMPSNRTSVFEELSVLLRTANCRGYLSPTGRLLVTYTDEMPLWATAMRNDLGSRPGVTGLTKPDTRFHLPLTQVRAVFPDRVIAQSESIWGIGPPWTEYPAQMVTDQNDKWTMPMFEFTEHNVSGVERIEDSEILNEVRARTTPEADTRDFIDLSGMTLEDLETLTFGQIGDAATSIANDGASVAEYGLRWRTYDSGGLSEIARGTKTPTGPPATTQPSVNYGRYALYRGDFAEAQMRARRFPVQRIRVTSPGILSVLPFELVTVNLPNEGVQGYFQIEGRHIEVGSSGFRSVDTLRRMDLPAEIVTLDARDDAQVQDP